MNDPQPAAAAALKSPAKVRRLFGEVEQLLEGSTDPMAQGMLGMWAMGKGYVAGYVPEDPDKLDELLLWLARNAIDCRSDDAAPVALVDVERRT